MKRETILLVEQLNKLTWKSMTSADVIQQNASPEVVATLNELVDAGYSILMGSIKYNYTIGELRAIEKIIAWISQIIYAKDLIQKEADVEGEDAELEMYVEMINQAETGLLEYQALHPDGIPFFLIEGNCVILKSSPYFLIEERLMYKTGLLISQSGDEEDKFV
ncbi:MAG: hypothetical protein WCG95_07055 [bacterium]